MMLARVVITAALVAAGAAFGTAGDLIRTFPLPGQPSDGVRGLAMDWGDGNVWAVGPAGQGTVLFNKFVPATGSTLASWRLLPGAVWCFDLGYGYTVNSSKHLVLVHRYPPRVQLYTTAGSFYGTLPDPFPGGYDTGCACSGDVNIYVTNFRYNDVYRWRGSSWAAYAACPAGPAEGAAVGWGRLFVVTTAPDYSIYEFDAESGSLYRSIPLRNWGTRFMVGMSIGRVNARGGEESVFLALYYPAEVIAEVSVGDVTATAVTPTSLGRLRALYY